MDVAFLQLRIAATKAQILALQAAIDGVIDLTISHYDLDDGQGRQLVRRADLPKLIALQDTLDNRLCTLQARLSGGGAVMVTPQW